LEEVNPVAITNNPSAEIKMTMANPLKNPNLPLSVF
jgi:hypothetical protein